MTSDLWFVALAVCGMVAFYWAGRMDERDDWEERSRRRGPGG